MGSCRYWIFRPWNLCEICFLKPDEYIQENKWQNREFHQRIGPYEKGSHEIVKPKNMNIITGSQGQIPTLC